MGLHDMHPSASARGSLVLLFALFFAFSVAVVSKLSTPASKSLHLHSPRTSISSPTAMRDGHSSLFFTLGHRRVVRSPISSSLKVPLSPVLESRFSSSSSPFACSAMAAKDNIVSLADEAFKDVVVEYPQYKTLERRPSYKVRLYPKSIAIQVKENSKLSIRDQIGLLADYVGAGKGPNGKTKEPQNTEKMNVPITAPLLMPGAAVVGLGNSRIQLILPPDFGLSDAPSPLDPNLRLVEIPEHVCAIQNIVQKENLEKQLKTLVEVLERDDHLVDKSSWQVLHYRSPWFNPMFNSDELAVGLRKYVHCRENRNTLWCTEY